MASFTGSRILDAERHTEAVTAAAKHALIHLLHHPAFVRGTRRYCFIVAITAGVPFFGVRLMAEIYVSGIRGKFIPDCAKVSGMALHTVGLYAEGGFVIMATAAGFALFHLTHGKALVAGARNEEIGMAILAAVGGYMDRMVELGAAGAEMDLFDRMAFLAVRFHTKGTLAIVTGTA